MATYIGRADETRLDFTLQGMKTRHEGLAQHEIHGEVREAINEAMDLS